MTHEVMLAVRLKITDNDAFSALEALHAKMGLSNEVSGLLRETLWELGVEAPSIEEAHRIVEEAISRTNVFLNPNKHYHEFLPGGQAASGLAPDEVGVVVTDRDGAESPRALAAVSRAGVPEVTSARRSVRWRLRLTRAPEPGNPGTIELIKRISVTTHRDAGLLVNPHSQSAMAVLPWGEQKPLVG